MTSGGADRPRLSLHPDGADRLTDWWKSSQATNADRKLVGRVVRQLQDGGLANCTFFRMEEPTDPTLALILPREFLVVAVRLVTHSQFTIVTIHELEQDDD